MKVIELRAWYLDWTTKPVDTRREINQALTEETFDEFLGEVNIKDLEHQEAQPSAPSLHTTIPKSDERCQGHRASLQDDRTG